MPTDSTKKQVLPISVIIPSYGRSAVLMNTIESILDGKCIPGEIIVIHQGDGLVVLPPQVKMIHSSIVSSTHARNVGIDVAQNEVLLFCDDDILFNRESLQNIWAKIKNDDTALVAAIHYEENGIYKKQHKNLMKDIVSTFMGLKKFWKRCGYVIKSNIRGRYPAGMTNAFYTEWAMGYCFAVKKSVCEKYHIRFDENLIRYAYCEDLDFTYRYCLASKKCDLKTIVDPAIYVNHLASKEWRTPSDEMVLYMIANRLYLSYKLFPQAKKYRVAMKLYNALYGCFMLNSKQEKVRFRKIERFCYHNEDRVQEGSLSELKDKLCLIE